MPFGNIWTCTNCGHSVRTAGLFKFYIDNNGIRHRCGHPIPSEAEKRYGASGYSLEGYCPFHGVRDVIIAEFEPQREFKNICDVCGEKLLDNLKNLSCPKCGKGKFKEAARWMS